MNIVLGVTGGIAAYKAVALARLFVESGHALHVVPTVDALRFVGQPTWEAISRNPVTTSVHDNVPEVRHVSLGQRADLIVIAPATANTLAKMSVGIADDLLGTTLLATEAPVLVAPAMHTEMWQHPATQHNVKVLQSRGIQFIGPEHGRLTGTDTGPGRMSEPQHIFERALELLHSAPSTSSASELSTERHDPVLDLTGVRVLVTAGGTREPIDPVRYLGNRSSGRQGVALAAAAEARGATVTLIAANIDEHVLAGVGERTTIVHVGSAAELEAATLSEALDAQVIIMAAAVADYRVSDVAQHKIRKEDLGHEAPVLTLVENPDILRGLVTSRLPGQLIVGFAAETLSTDGSTGDLELLDRARRKLARKGCDLLAVNAVGWQQGFEATENEIALLQAGGDVIATARGSKREVADSLLDAIVSVHHQDLHTSR